MLGSTGMMRPTQARRRSDAAEVHRRVIGVAHIASNEQGTRLAAQGFAAVRCELRTPAQLDRLPEAPMSTS